MSNNISCPTCNGTGKQKVTMVMVGSDKPDETYMIECVLCDGAGKISQAQADALKREEEMWCSCDADVGVNFFDDGQHPDLHKHHYRCKACDGIKQIG